MRLTVADRLATARRRALVGRVEELRRAEAFLDDPAVVVLQVHGPGGVGKSTLLRAVEDLASGRDRPTRWVDAADLSPTREEVLAAVMGGPTIADATRLPQQTVTVLDHAEHLGPLESWLWHTVIPALPDDCQIVVGSRRPPPPEVREPGWSELVSVVPLRNLPPVDAEHLLRSRGVPDDVDVTGLVRSTHGHPLALVIAADEYAGRGAEGSAPFEVSALLEHPDAAARLLGSFVDDVAAPLHRRALHVTGHARRVDRSLLMSVLGLDEAAADEVLDWLRERPYAESHPDGLSVHDLVRDALDRDLRWRDKEAFASLHRRIRDVALDRMARSDGSEHARAVADLLFLHRGNPDAEGLYGFEDLLALSHRRAAEGDRDHVVEAFATADGRERAAVMAQWFDADPSTFHVVEDADGAVVGSVAGIRLDVAEPVQDPLVPVIRSELERRRPSVPGEPLMLFLVADGRAPERLGGFSDQVASISLREWTVPRLGWVVVASTRATTWTPIWGYIGLEPLGELALTDGVLTAWGRDFARSDYAAWLDALLLRELDRDGTAPPPVSSPVALARGDFDVAVRGALRDDGRPERLRANPLLSSQLVRAEGTDDPVVALRRLVRAAVDVVRLQARGMVPAAAVDRTYLRPAATQELAAELLGLPFSTYRRHLRAGVQRVTEVLWDWELHGVPGPEVDRN
ncbi:hypothetical protein [Thalassiella azotivora]